MNAQHPTDLITSSREQLLLQRQLIHELPAYFGGRLDVNQLAVVNATLAYLFEGTGTRGVPIGNLAYQLPFKHEGVLRATIQLAKHKLEQLGDMGVEDRLSLLLCRAYSWH